MCNEDEDMMDGAMGMCAATKKTENQNKRGRRFGVNRRG